MEKIKLLKVYNFVDKDGDNLQLRFGILENVRLPKGDTGYRWSFIGTKIPMPIRSDTWFNGFPVETMLEWLKGNGWEVQLIVNTVSGKIEMFTTSFNYESDKGNEAIELFDVSDIPTCNGLEHGVIEEVVKILWRCDRRLTAVKLYRLVKKCYLATAKNAVEAICENA